jgi:hypothetical protein
MATNPSPGIRWGRALVAAILGEVVLILVAIPIFAAMGQEDATGVLNIVIPPASFLVFVGAGYWSAKPVPGKGLLQGGLAGLVAVVAYLALGLVASQFVAGRNVTDGFTPAYLLAHALKIAGGAAGGYLAARRG